MRSPALAVALVFSLAAAPAYAGLPSRVVQETGEFLMKKFARAAAAEGAERLATRLSRAVARHGTGVLAVTKKVGPKALTLMDEAGENAPRVLRLLGRYGDDAVRVVSRPKAMGLIARYGDDAADVLIRHKGVAEPVLEKLGKPAVKALGAVGPQGGRRMAMMATELASGGHAPQLLAIVSKYGDEAMNFIWQHRAVLAGGAALTAFLANPEPYLKGTADLARVGVEGAGKLTETVAEHALKPAVVAVGNVAVKESAAVRQGLFLAPLGVTVAAVVTGAVVWCKALPLRLAARLIGARTPAAAGDKP